MPEPYKHKLGEFKPEHFDGDPIDQPMTPARKKQAEAMEDRIIKKNMPKNAIDKGKPGKK